MQVLQTKIQQFVEAHSNVSWCPCVPCVTLFLVLHLVCVGLIHNKPLHTQWEWQPCVLGSNRMAQVYLGSPENNAIPDKYGLGYLWSMNSVNVSVSAALAWPCVTAALTQFGQGKLTASRTP